MKNLQESDPRCPSCGQPIFKVYCTPVPDAQVRLTLRKLGRSDYAGPCHRINLRPE